jgi:uncharacterized protein (DUF433 family)
MSESDLMKKYRLSLQGLNHLMQELAGLGLIPDRTGGKAATPRKRVKVKDFIKDFRAGLSDAELTRKYDLSHDALYILLQKLMNMRALKPDELFGDLDIKSGSVSPLNVRELERYYLDFQVVIFDASRPENKGVIRDVTEKGIGILGISCTPGELRTFVVTPENSPDIEPFLLRAECRWSDIQLEGEFVSGFSIEEISEDDLASLRMLIKHSLLNETDF